MPEAPFVEETGFYRLVRALGTPVIRGAFRLRSAGTENVPASGPCVLAANHLSYLDPLVIGATCPRAVRFMMTRRFWEMPVVGWASRRAGSFPVHEGRIAASTLRQALGILRGGGVLGIFPEGGISPDGCLRPARPGAARLALATGAPVCPAGIVGTRRALQKGRALPRLFSPVIVRYGDPIPPASVDGLPPPEREAALTATIAERIAALAADPLNACGPASGPRGA